MNIRYQGVTPMPSFIMFYISLKSLYFMGFARFPKLTGHHSGHHSICYGIKFYTTFNASATRSISRCFSSSVICTYRFIVMPILECPNIFCKVLRLHPTLYASGCKCMSEHMHREARNAYTVTILEKTCIISAVLDRRTFSAQKDNIFPLHRHEL